MFYMHNPVSCFLALIITKHQGEKKAKKKFLETFQSSCMHKLQTPRSSSIKPRLLRLKSFYSLKLDQKVIAKRKWSI